MQQNLISPSPNRNYGGIPIPRFLKSFLFLYKGRGTLKGGRGTLNEGRGTRKEAPKISWWGFFQNVELPYTRNYL